jgi:hypothetical protein
MQQMLEEAQSNCKTTGDYFQNCWKPLGNKFKKLHQYYGGVASVMPGTSSVESDFSIINWTKDSHFKCLTYFSLVSILHCKQYGMLQKLSGQQYEIIDKVCVTLTPASFSITLTLKIES